MASTMEYSIDSIEYSVEDFIENSVDVEVVAKRISDSAFSNN